MEETDETHIKHVPDPISTPQGQLNPYPWYRQMREEAPVRYDSERDCWDVFGYDAVKRVATDFETFSSEFDATPIAGPDEERVIDLGETMIRRDPPEHERLRGIVDEYFRPGALREFNEEFEQLTNEQLDRVLEDGESEFDFVREFASPIPSRVIAEILGVPPENQELFVKVGPGSEYSQRELKSYITELIRERTENPTDDILSEVIHAEPDGYKMTEEEIYQFCALLLLAGSQTTITLLTNAVWLFAEHDIVSEIRDGVIDHETAIEEVLRYRPPVHRIRRVATEAVDLDGVTIQAGDRVAAWIGSAHRDPRAFEKPATFDPSRAPNPHLAFGSGIHFCLGAPLARIEANIVLSVFLDRVSDVRLATDDFEPIMNSTMYGLRSLPLSVRTP
ncbi:cytochrome P450 [Halocatena marina]|uniref:cytochrome P450 n=1 Tax=Halocatena marina TaxID=2934937 RepID=UPI002010A6CD|nr:cytochrome P450 [Halocatena marina]